MKVEQQFKYPIIVFSKGSALYFARNKDDITTASATGFRKGFYENLLVVDSDGEQYKIKDATKIGTVRPFWGISLFRGQHIRVSLNLLDHRNSKIDLKKFKDSVIKRFYHDKYFWDADGELSKRIEFVQEAKTHKVIIEKLTENFYKDHKVKKSQTKLILSL